ncbi:hypothetical protein HK405_001113, partial [Cladochytrium tenue]
ALCDSFLQNSMYAKVGGISTKELNMLELEFLFLIDWDLTATTENLQEYYKNLVRQHPNFRRTVSGVRPDMIMPPPMPAFGGAALDFSPTAPQKLNTPTTATANVAFPHQYNPHRGPSPSMGVPRPYVPQQPPHQQQQQLALVPPGGQDVPVYPHRPPPIFPNSAVQADPGRPYPS